MKSFKISFDEYSCIEKYVSFDKIYLLNGKEINTSGSCLISNGCVLFVKSINNMNIQDMGRFLNYLGTKDNVTYFRNDSIDLCVFKAQDVCEFLTEDNLVKIENIECLDILHKRKKLMKELNYIS